MSQPAARLDSKYLQVNLHDQQREMETLWPRKQQNCPKENCSGVLDSNAGEYAVMGIEVLAGVGPARGYTLCTEEGHRKG